MALLYQPNGYLIVGIHLMTFEEFVREYGYNPMRLRLIKGLELAIKHLSEVGCKTIYIGGSFVTKKVVPNDYDVCFDAVGINGKLVMEKYPVFFDFVSSTVQQKIIYGGEFYPAYSHLKFFQLDRNDIPKGIIQINI